MFDGILDNYVGCGINLPSSILMFCGTVSIPGLCSISVTDIVTPKILPQLPRCPLEMDNIPNNNSKSIFSP